MTIINQKDKESDNLLINIIKAFKTHDVTILEAKISIIDVNDIPEDIIYIDSVLH